jgi:8-oxo-dGDP phosphatase
MSRIERMSSRQVYANRWITVREDVIRRPDGSDGIYGVIDKPDYALVIACTNCADGEQFALVEQFRYPLGLRRWEFPQGNVGLTSIDPAALAVIELREETGLQAQAMTLLGLLDVAPGMSSQRGRVFLATGITEGESQREHEEQDMRFAWFGRAQVEQMMRTGVITDAQSIAAWTLLALRKSR